MASTSCWKCLLRPSISPASYGLASLPLRTQPLAAFSTTTFVGYPPKVAPGGKKPSSRKTPPPKQARTLKLKKKTVVKSGRPPNPGERKAARKRIVLSNTNAIEVTSMTDVTPELLLDIHQVGRVLGIPGALIDQLRAVEAFKITQGWGLFRRPGMLIREETIQIAKLLKKAKDTKQTTAVVLDGVRGTGKSMLLLQALATAFMDDWIVVNIPEAQELTNAGTDYAPVPGTSPQQYTQNVYASNLLAQIVKANDGILSKLTITQEHDLPIPIAKNINLSKLAEIGAKDSEIAWPIFQAVWKEITANGRPPLLFTLDGLSHIMKESAYRNPDFALIHSHDFLLVKLFTECLNGSQKFPNGGAVIAATSRANSPHSYAVDISSRQKVHAKEISQLPAGVEAPEYPEIEPYKKLDMRAYESLRHAQLLMLKGLSKDEARGLMEYWAASGVMRQRVDEKTIAEKLALAGNGVIGEIQRNALWMRI